MTTWHVGKFSLQGLNQAAELSGPRESWCTLFLTAAGGKGRPLDRFSEATLTAVGNGGAVE